MLKNSCPPAINCCPPKCPVDQVICINCCIPVSVTCDGNSTQEVFQHINPCEVISGFVSIENDTCPTTNTECTILATIQERGNLFTIPIASQDREGIFVTDLLSISLTATGLNINEIVTGEVKFQLQKIIALDC